jgi:hypothetical protein
VEFKEKGVRKMVKFNFNSYDMVVSNKGVEKLIRFSAQ